MKCMICRNGETRLGAVTVTMEREKTTLVIRGVPADVCENCGEEYVSDETAGNLEKELDAAVASKVVVEVREFAA